MIAAAVAVVVVLLLLLLVCTLGLGSSRGLWLVSACLVFWVFRKTNFFGGLMGRVALIGAFPTDLLLAVVFV